MAIKSLKLPESVIQFLIGMPENGMGYQLVKVMLKGGKVLHDYKVINSTLLLLEGNEKISLDDIEKVELER